ncbi:MAG: flagellar basal body P-ring formation protein FlgA [Phycisphaeraceae bacterium]|nr:flagellar basal body P-ring formation protein FlgA [Phycisphaeraceae bacterium]
MTTKPTAYCLLPTAWDFLRRIALFLIGAAVIGCAIAAHGDSIRLNDQAVARGGSITLGQIAELDGVLAQALSDTVVATMTDQQNRTTVTLDTVRRALEQRKINWADVSLCGYAACRVVIPEAEPSVAVSDASLPGGVSNPRDEVTLNSRMTLRDLLIERIERMAGASSDQLQINFDQRDDEQLKRTIFGQRYEVEPHTQNGLGRLLLRVRRYELDQVVEQFTIAADVSKRLLAVVAATAVERGQSFTSGNCEVRQILLDDANVQPLEDPDLLLGQTAARQLRAGQTIVNEDVRSAVLIKRGELVMVRCISGNLVIRTTARAVQDGAMNETIRLRNERSREEFSASVTGLRQATLTLNADTTLAMP